MVEQALEAANSASPEEKAALQGRCGSLQEDLAAFAVVYSQHLPDRERALVLALLPLVLDVFLRSGATFRTIRRAEILHAWKASAAFVRDLRTGVDGKGNVEPEVLLLVLDLLLETEPAEMEPEAPPLVAVRILKTVTDCLNRAGVQRR